MDKEFYNLGKRDAVAEIFMLVRTNKGDFKKTFKELVEQYEKIDKENPHCEWIKKFLREEIKI